jgi:uncharacterized protein (DUF2147 family)
MRRVLIVILILLSINSFAQNQIIGKWMTEDKKGITEIYKLNGKFYGKIVWLQKPKDEKGFPVTDLKNPDKALKKRALIGLVILKDLYYIDNEWSNGTIYDPQTGKTYTCTLKLADNNSLKVKGYWGILSETHVWTRTK